ncbi:MAG: alpha/beta hydrolase [Marinovum sp.]|nr:alpha/beta hydrolase [Marinovum sp.]
MSDATQSGFVLRAYRTRYGVVIWPWALAIVLGVIIGASLWRLESSASHIDTQELWVGETPVTLYGLPGARAPAPLAVVAHGFGGSRQMMSQISVSLADRGFVVASFDFPGHGRSRARMSRDITRVEGTTAQLVATTNIIANAMRARSDTSDAVVLVGHSMATDVVIRAAALRDDVAAVAAISMYSPAVSDTHPKRLLMVSGAFEGHLRTAALDALNLIDASASEGETAVSGDISRRAFAAPMVGHVGVLYEASALQEITDWLGEAVGLNQRAALDLTGWISGLLIMALAVLAWPLSRVLPKQRQSCIVISGRVFWLAIFTPILPAVSTALVPIQPLAGAAAFGTIAVILAVWGVVQIGTLWWAGVRMTRLDALGSVSYLAYALVFALVLDNYSAAFLPTGVRAPVFFALILASAPAMVADTLLMAGAPLWQRALARIALLIAFAGAMSLAPTDFGISFTVLPVLVLFFAVFGSMGRWVMVRRGPGAAALGKSVALAWSLAASTPIFMPLLAP